MQSKRGALFGAVPVVLVFVAAAALAARGATVPRANAVATIAGDGAFGTRDGPALSARFMFPAAVASGSTGRIYVADGVANQIRLIAGGRVSTVAGATGTGGGYLDGPALRARFNQPLGLAVSRSGDVYVADTLNHCIRVLHAGSVSTVAGAPTRIGAADGDRETASFSQPRALSFDEDGNLYVADFGVGVRRIALDGSVSTLELADSTKLGFTGVSALGRGADLVVFAAANNTTLERARSDAAGKLAPAAVVQIAAFVHPHGIVALAPDRVLIADPVSNVVRLYRAADFPVTTGSETAVAGTALEEADEAAGYEDGPLDAARFDAPASVTLERNGRVIVADADGRRVRAFPLPSLRGPVGSHTEVFASNPKSFHITLVANSYAWLGTEWPESAGGILERRLQADAAASGVRRPVQVDVVRLDGATVPATATYIDEVVAPSHPGLVVFLLNELEFTLDWASHAPGGSVFPKESFMSALPGELRALRDTLAHDRTPLLVALQPVEEDVSPRAWIDDRELGSAPLFSAQGFAAIFPDMEAATGRSGVDAVSLYPDFLAYEHGTDRPPLFRAEDGHFTRAGNAFVARLLVREIERRHPWRAMERSTGS